MIIKLLLIIGIISICSAYTSYRYRYSNKKNQTYGYETTMTGKQFKSIYMLDPSKWRFSYIMHPGYSTISTSQRFLLYNATGDWSLTKGGILSSGLYVFKNKNSIIRVHLSFFAWLYYIYIKKIFYETEMDKGMEIILKSAQNDIDKLKAQAQQEFHNANKMMGFITKFNAEQEERANND